MATKPIMIFSPMPRRKRKSPMVLPPASLYRLARRPLGGRARNQHSVPNMLNEGLTKRFGVNFCAAGQL
ncbi:MAG: hypothetical protein ACREE3_13325, partial [Stellaceae bacterium]